MSDKVVNKRNFTVNDLELAVRKPTVREKQEAQRIYAKVMREATRDGAMLRVEAERVMQDRGLWDAKRQADFADLSKRLGEIEKSLAQGGIKLSDAKDQAIEARRIRYQQREMLAERSALEGATAEGQAEQAQFNYFVSVGTVYANNGNPYFKSLDDYLSREDEVTNAAGAQMAFLIHGLDPDFDKRLFENEFLLKHKLVDENLHLIDKKGRKVNLKGELVDDGGRLVGEDGKPLETEVKPQPFLDDDGKPLAA